MSNLSQDADVADDIPTASKVVETIILSIIITVSLVGNTSLWIVVLRTQKLRTITNMFILGLSAADILVATVNMPITVYTIIKGNWMFSDGVCVAVGFINMLTLVTSVLSLCNISINRFFMICRPGKFKKIYTIRNAILMIFVTVASALLLSSPPLLGWSQYVYTHGNSICFADWANTMTYAYFMIGCCFGIPFCVMTFCNIFIIHSVRRSRRHLQNYKKKNNMTVQNSISSESSDALSSENNSRKITQTDSILTSEAIQSVSINLHTLDTYNNGLESGPKPTSKQMNIEDIRLRGRTGHCKTYQESSVDSNMKSSDRDATPKGSGWKQRQSSRHRREEIRLAVSLIVVVLLFVICWLPYCISMLISIHYDGPVPREFIMFALLLGYANSGCNPIVYGLMNRRFKLAFNKLFCFWSVRLTISDMSVIHRGSYISSKK